VNVPLALRGSTYLLRFRLVGVPVDAVVNIDNVKGASGKLGSSVVCIGTGSNPVVLDNVQPPAVGNLWEEALDCSGAVPSIAALAISFGPKVSVATKWGELMVLTGGGLGFTLVQPHASDVVNFGPLLIPPDPSIELLPWDSARSLLGPYAVTVVVDLAV